MAKYAPLLNFLDNIPIEARVDAYLESERWPGYPMPPANPNPLIVKNINDYVTLPRPRPQPGGRVFRKNQRYAFLSDYNTYP